MNTDPPVPGDRAGARALSDEMVPVRGGRFCLPRRFMARIDDMALPWLLTLTAAVGDDGEPYCESFTVQARPGARVLSSDVRFPLKQFLRIAAAAVRDTPGDDNRHQPSSRSLAGLREYADFISVCARDRPPEGVRGTRGKTYDDEHYRTVAAVFLSAPDGTTGIQYVVRVWPASYGTAKRWVAECRKRGLLPPVKPRGRRTGNDC